MGEIRNAIIMEIAIGGMMLFDLRLSGLINPRMH
jgi:hypothetical protein